MSSLHTKRVIGSALNQAKTAISQDWTNVSVSSPHPVSQIRLLKESVLKNETVEEKQFRQKRIQVQLWHHKFWFRNNTRFSKERDEYTNAIISEGRKPTADDLSNFYKLYLNKVYKDHIVYTKKWWIHNLHLVYLGSVAQVSKLRRLF